MSRRKLIRVTVKHDPATTGPAVDLGDSKVQHSRIGTTKQPDARVLYPAHVAQGALRSRRNPLELVGSTIDLISALPVASAHCLEAHGAPAVRVKEGALADRRSKRTQQLWFAVQER